MSRPFTDITKSKTSQPIKNGTLVTSVQKTGNYKTNNDTVSNTPDLSTIEAKYGNRFYNGIFVEVISTT
jgi:hypothetical protein